MKKQTRQWASLGLECEAGHKLELTNCSSKDIEETTCHRCRGAGSPSSMLLCPGRGGWSNNTRRASAAASRYDPGSPFVSAATNCSATASCRSVVVTKQSAQLDSTPLGSPLVHLMTTGGQRLPTTPQESQHPKFVANKFAETTV